MTNDSFDIKGELQIDVWDEAGNLRESIITPNLVVSVGKNLAATGLGTGTTTAMAYMAVGTSAIVPALPDTALNAEVGRVALTSTVVLGNVITYQATFNPGVATGTLQEAGLLSALTAGSLLSHATFVAINKAAGDTVAVTWTLTLG
jgi:hypothetical protein